MSNLNNYRLAHAGFEHVLPLLLKRREAVLGRIVSSYRSGERDFVGLAAELAVIADMQQEFKINEAKLNKSEEERANELR